MTLLELVITIGLLATVIMAILPIMTSVQQSYERESDRSQSNDQARLAVEELDREIRSGNVLYDPASESDPANGIYPGMSLRIYTQTNASTRTPGNRCVQWRVVNGALQTRNWSITWQTDGNVSGWHIVADHVVNQPNPPTPPTTPAFQLDPDPSKGGRSVIITIQVQQDPQSGVPVQIRQAVTGRNTEYGYPSTVCQSIPPY